MKVEDIVDVDKFLEELIVINSTVTSPTIEDFVLTFSPEMKPKKVKKIVVAKLDNTTNINNNTGKKLKRCPDTIDFIEVEFGDKYQKCKGSGY